MTLPPHGSAHYEVRRRIAGCRERLRKARTANREVERATRPQGAGDESGGEPCGGGDEEDGSAGRKLNSSRRGGA